jgi:phage terminase small subunit
VPRKTPALKVVGTRSAEVATAPQPPAHLGPDGLSLWRAVQLEYSIDDPAGLELLRQAVEAADRIASVKKQIDESGELLVIKGVPRVNPLCAVERDARAALVRCIRNLNLDLEPLKARGRPAGASFV